MSELQKAQRRYELLNRAFKCLITLAIVYAISVLSILTFQTYQLQSAVVRNQAVNREAAERRLELALQGSDKQHKVTQEYIKCVAKVLLKPIEQRRAADFDACGITETDNG